VPHYPAAGDGITLASADGLVAVTSVDQEKKKPKFANYGLWVDIAAPGEGIRSTYPVNQYATWDGTSMSTPFVSGQAALIKQVYGSIKPKGIESRIHTKAKPLADEPLWHDDDSLSMMGAGHADVCASLR
jgi:subtilisin family serine protease